MNAGKLCRSQARRVAAAVAIVAAYVVAAPAHTPPDARDELAQRFHFSSRVLRAPMADAQRTVREVHPDYQHIVSWISSVGAAVALGDFDGDGVDNDVCLVDTRARYAVVMPVTGTGDRYPPIELVPPPGSEPDRTVAPMGCLLTDLDEDGVLDAVVYYWGRVPAGFLHRGNTVVAFDLAPAARWFSNAGAVGDLDGDGHLDLVIGNYFPDGSRVLDRSATDAAVMQDSMSRAYNGGAKHVLLWKSRSENAVELVEADLGLESEVLHGWTLAIGVRDLDGDLRPEIYLANDFGPDRLLHNLSTPGALKFELVEGRRGASTPRSKVIGADSFKGMGVAFGDVDRDGDDDIAVSNIAAPWALLESNFLFIDDGAPGAALDGARYIDRSEPLGVSRGGWAWDLRFGDFDSDGWLELVQANGFVKGRTDRWAELQELATGNDGLLKHPGAWPHFGPGDDLSGHQRNMFFARSGRDAFTDVAPELGLPGADVTRGLATGDVDGDGDLDLAIANQWEDSQLLINDAPQGSWLSLRLQLGAGTVELRKGSHAVGRPAVGAKTVITLPDGRTLRQEVDGGSGHSGKSAPTLHWGLGVVDRDARIPVEIQYRDRRGVVHTERVTVTPGVWTVRLPEAP